ncbi:MAG TPA: hypothetical protein VJH90_03035 [archaeon]|nr:hypothetical protein [archaeon]
MIKEHREKSSESHLKLGYLKKLKRIEKGGHISKRDFERGLKVIL